MNSSVHSRRIVLIAALALLGLAWPASADKADGCGPFQAGGTFTNLDQQGAFFETTVSGRAKPGGAFTGAVSGKVLANDERETATVVYDFGGGDTLVTEVELERDPEDPSLLVGTFVITGGTGEFEGATGGGDQVVDMAARTFELDGTLCS